MLTFCPKESSATSKIDSCIKLSRANGLFYRGSRGEWSASFICTVYTSTTTVSLSDACALNFGHASLIQQWNKYVNMCAHGTTTATNISEHSKRAEKCQASNE